MTRQNTTQQNPISQKPLVIATELDGTFLGGDETARKGLYKFIEANRNKIGLIFVSDRDPQFVRDITRKEGVPRPDFVIGDVGTTIAAFDANNFVAPIKELEEEISDAWNDASMRVQSALRGAPGLKLQSTSFRFRVCYDLDPDTFDPKALEIVSDLGFDPIISSNQYFDVLPKGVTKGSSLLRLLTHLEVDNRRCLVAGNTLNDLSMLELGLPTVAVGNSEPALMERLAGLDHVHFAKGAGAAGIGEAIIAFDFFQKKAA